MEREPIITVPEKWNKEVDEIRLLTNDIHNGMKGLSERGIIKHKFGWSGYMSDVVFPELCKRAGTNKLQEYAVYHALIGSTPRPELSPKIDLPGGLISNFVKELHTKINIANETGKFEM